MVDVERFKVVIENGGSTQLPIVEGTLQVTWHRNGAPGKLVCNIVKDDNLDFQEGNALAFYVDDELFFYGYVFDKDRSGNQIIKTTCYDQIRYLKNKSTFQYENWTYSELLQNICADRHLQIGSIEETEIKIPGRIEVNREYYEMLRFASDFTTANSGKLYTLFDKGGKICLQSPESMKTTDVIDYDCTQDFDYQTSINENTYNRVHLKLLDDENKEIKSATAEDKSSIAKWGILSYSDYTNNEEIDIDMKAKELLGFLNRKNRKLKIKDIVGRVNVRAGSLVPVQMMGIGDIDINGFMLVDSVVHKFHEEHHFMDIEVFNKDISPAIAPQKLPQAQKVAGSDIPVSGNTAGALDYAKNAVGAKYSQANRNSPGSYDCSSLIMRSFQASGQLPKSGYNLTSRSIHTDKNFVEINKNQLQPGDVMWSEGHLAFYMGGNQTLEARYSTKKVGYSTMGNRFSRFYRIKE